MCTKKPITKRPQKPKRKAPPQAQPCNPCIITIVMPMPWTWCSSVTGHPPKKPRAKVVNMEIKIENSRS